MKKHKHAIENLRLKLKDLTEQKRQVKASIQALRFDGEGKRRPETGPERDALWHRYIWSTRPKARALHLAIGFLRGRPYHVMEAKCLDSVPMYSIHEYIAEACGDDKDLKAEWTLGRIQQLVEASVTSGQEAA